MKKTIAVFVAGIVAGAAGAWFAAGLHSAPAPQAPAPAQVQTPPPADAALADAQAALQREREKNARLEKCLARATRLVDKALEREKEGDAAGETPQAEGAVVAGDDIDILEELKKRLADDEFDEVTNAMERASIVRAAKAKDKLDFLSAIDTSRMSEKDRATHKKFVEKFRRREEVMSKLKGGIPSKDTLQEMVMAELDLASVSKEERQALLALAVDEMGYSGEEASGIVEMMESIFSCTSPGGMDGAVPEDLGEGMSGGISFDIQAIGL